MTTVFLYEFITAGGLFQQNGNFESVSSLLTEGQAMLRAVSRDLARIDGLTVRVLWDARLPRDNCPPSVDAVIVRDADSHAAALADGLVACDEALLIAPESDGNLTRLAHLATSSSARLLSPDARFVELASDKMATLRCLSIAGVPVPETYSVSQAIGRRLDPSRQWIVKPNGKAGSEGIRRVSGDRLSNELCAIATQRDADQWSVQAYCLGKPASVAALCNGRQIVLLPPCWQWLERERFTYLGGATIRPWQLVRRARRLAAEALDAMPATHGYVGIDLVLGETADQDVVIEVNPRMTTSYLGLSHVIDGNLAEAMRSVAYGNGLELSFVGRPLEFRVDEGVRCSESRPLRVI